MSIILKIVAYLVAFKILEERDMNMKVSSRVAH